MASDLLQSDVKYTIRYMPDTPGIESAHFKIWRPGMFQQPLRGFKAFETADTLAEALSKVNADIIKAMLEFAELTGQDTVDLVQAAWWHAAARRNEWKEPFR